ncbi:hypothetical protein V500_07085 [Pseudogymnoascus sp. VKM F-4518 (FW-2643)]|nr:hypothetical protein V500_07085 [Pseudogymnoascus sp. VKM F-4518 (FW-2643)]
MAPTIVLITGANRGLGEGILKRYLAKPDHIVIAANRNPDHETSKALADLPKGPGSRLIVVKIDARSETDASTAIQELKDQGIDHLDIVIANAAFIIPFVKIEDATLDDLRANTETNIYGFFLLYQATLPLLLKSQSPTWITIGSGAGSIVLINRSTQLPVPNAVYGPTKAAQHWLTKRINAEEEKICAFVMSPGWVQTEGGNSSAQILGLKEAPQPVEPTCDGMVEVFDKATKESHGGKFLSWEGKEESW